VGLDLGRVAGFVVMSSDDSSELEAEVKYVFMPKKLASLLIASPRALSFAENLVDCTHSAPSV
jgi:hypothetical protein